MEALNLDIDFEAELRKFQARRSSNRSAGIHLSDCLHRFYSRLRPNRFRGGPIDVKTVQMGFIWEDVLSMVLSQQFGGRQREIELDRVFMTLDGFNVQRWRVREFKCTKMSSRDSIRSHKFERWHSQIMGYCKAMDTLEAELIPVHINGAYEQGGGRFGDIAARPVLMRYTRREVEDNWKMVLHMRDEIERGDD